MQYYEKVDGNEAGNAEQIGDAINPAATCNVEFPHWIPRPKKGGGRLHPGRGRMFN